MYFGLAAVEPCPGVVELDLVCAADKALYMANEGGALHRGESELDRQCAGVIPVRHDGDRQQLTSQKLRSTALRRVAKCSTHHMCASAFAMPPRHVYRTFVLSHLQRYDGLLCESVTIERGGVDKGVKNKFAHQEAVWYNPAVA
jgi:hypothetical protein